MITTAITPFFSTRSAFFSRSDYMFTLAESREDILTYLFDGVLPCLSDFLQFIWDPFLSIPASFPHFFFFSFLLQPTLREQRERGCAEGWNMSHFAFFVFIFSGCASTEGGALGLKHVTKRLLGSYKKEDRRLCPSWKFPACVNSRPQVRHFLRTSFPMVLLSIWAFVEGFLLIRAAKKSV